MMNMQNLGSQESVRVKYIEDIYAKFSLKLWFESDWYVCNITESRWFKMQSRSKVPNNHFIKSVQKQPYADIFKIVFLKISRRCFPVNIAKFLRILFL